MNINLNLDKNSVGLGNVDNTSDVNKPVSTAQQTAITLAETTAKAYADTLVVGLLDDRGNYDASVNTFPASGGSGSAGSIKKGDLWTISVAGTLGGVAVTVGDVVRALVDTPGQTSSNWVVTENNIGYVPENSSNKTSTVSGNESSTSLYATIKGFVDWLKQGFTSALPSKTTPVDADSVLINDSADSNKTKLVTYTNVKAFLKTYFDTLYVSSSNRVTGISRAFATSYNPTDASTVYVGFTNNQAPNAAVAARTITAPASSTQLIQFTAYITGTLGTTEGVTINLVNNTAGTSTQLTNSSNWSTSTVHQTYSSTLTFSAGDKYSIEIVHPTWATNPTTVFVCFDITFRV
jgi:hypothetical protein